MSGHCILGLLGRLTRDPETRFSASGTAIVKFGLAFDRSVKRDGEWTDEPVFVDVTMFGKRGEAFDRYHSKGSQAFVEGTLAFDKWDDKQTGAPRSKLYMIANTWTPVGSRPAATQQQDDTPF